MKKESHVSKIAELINLGLEGRLLIEDLERDWPKTYNQTEVFQILYEDLEDAVRHVPAFIFSNKIDYKMWNTQFEYKVLVCDSHLMPYIDRPEMWKALREKLINNSNNWTYKSLKEDLEKLLKVV